MQKTAYKMNINQFQELVLGTGTYMQIWTPREIGACVAVCSESVDLTQFAHNGVQEVDTGGNLQLEHGQIILITDIK